MTTDFSALNLRPELVQAVTERGYTAPTPIQASLIPVMLTGVDVIGQAQTGTGKTAAFALPLLQNLTSGSRNVQALVLTPTRELAVQVADAIQAYGKHQGARVIAIYGGSSYTRQTSSLKRGMDVVVGTPGRLIDLMNQKVLNLSAVKTVVLDEADEMLSMGFIEDIEAILAATPSERQTALFSATLPKEIRHLANKYMRDPQSILIKRDTLTLTSTTQRHYVVHPSDKLAALTRLFEVEEPTSAIIFARTRIGTTELSNELSMRGFPSESLNGDLSQEARERTLNRFRQSQVKVLVATDVAARGLDIDNVSHVFNYDLPEDPEIYVHRIGRTGRAGKTGVAISLVTPREKGRLRDIEAFTKQNIQRANVPSPEEVQAKRETQMVDKVLVWLERGRFKRERELLAKLIEAGHDPLDIAAAALKMSRGDEKQRTILSVTEVTETKSRTRTFERGSERSFDRSSDRKPDYKRSDRSRGSSRNTGDAKSSHEAGMVRLTLNKGKSHGIRPNDVVGMIAFHADIPGSHIGKILIDDKKSFVDVPEQFLAKVLAKAGKFTIRKEAVKVEKA